MTNQRLSEGRMQTGDSARIDSEDHNVVIREGHILEQTAANDHAKQSAHNKNHAAADRDGAAAAGVGAEHRARAVPAARDAHEYRHHVAYRSADELGRSLRRRARYAESERDVGRPDDGACGRDRFFAAGYPLLLFGRHDEPGPRRRRSGPLVHVAAARGHRQGDADLGQRRCRHGQWRCRGGPGCVPHADCDASDGPVADAW